MARIARNARLETREARARLTPRHQPYFTQIEPGLSLGYRKGARGGTWLRRQLTDGRYSFDTLGTADDRSDADGREVLSFAQAQRQAMGLRPDGTLLERSDVYTVADGIADYLEWAEAETAPGSHAEASRIARLRILPALGSVPAAELTTGQIDRWKQDVAKAPKRNRSKVIAVDPDDHEARRKRRATANRALTVLRAALNHAWRNGRVPSAEAWRRVRPFKKVDAPVVRFLGEDDCARLINAANAEFRPLLQAALLTGARYGELIQMRCQDYRADPEHATVTVRASKSETRHIPLTAEGAELFDELTAGRPSSALIFTRANGEAWRRTDQARPMRQASAKAGLASPVSFHLLRHAYAGLLAKQGVSLQVIAAVLGHADTRMTEKHYAHLAPDHVAEAVRAHLPSFGTGNNVKRPGGHPEP